MNLFGVSFGIIKLDYLRKFFYIVPKLPRQVNIEASNKCNLNCKICKRKELKISPSFLDFSKYTKIIDSLPKDVGEISFGGFGEQFLNPKVYDMIRYAKKADKKVSITTNGYFILNKNNRRRVLETNIDILRFSIETIKPINTEGHVYNPKLLKACEQVRIERDNFDKKTALMFNTVVCATNFNQVIDIIKYGQSIGMDAVELLHLDKKQNQISKPIPKDEEISLYKQIRKMNFNIRVPSLYDRYIGVRRFAFRNMKYCPFTFDVCHITIDGDVTPCCFGLPRYKIGNIFESSLEQIWNSSAFKNFRKDQQKICAGCTLMRFD